MLHQNHKKVRAKTESGVFKILHNIIHMMKQ